MQPDGLVLLQDFLLQIVQVKVIIELMVVAFRVSHGIGQIVHGPIGNRLLDLWLIPFLFTCLRFLSLIKFLRIIRVDKDLNKVS
jgi:hypothetical protein